MKYLDSSSLFQTVDNVSEALLFGLNIREKEKNEIADFIIHRQVKEAYAGTFAPTEYDSNHQLILFTGEKIKTRAGRYHMIGEEASRILRKLNISEADVKNALQKADTGLRNKIEGLLHDNRYEFGMYCCKSCSCALWINLSSGGLYDDSRMLEAGLRYLKRYRDNKGSWKGFPGNYVLYVLNEIDPDLAMEELKYAGLSVERRYNRKKAEETKYQMRRNFIYEQILNKINRYSN